MQSVGICGSDVRFWQWGKVGHFNLSDPLVMGHEGSGCVVAIGDGVKHLQIGMYCYHTEIHTPIVTPTTLYPST